MQEVEADNARLREALAALVALESDGHPLHGTSAYFDEYERCTKQASVLLLKTPSVASKES